MSDTLTAKAKEILTEYVRICWAAAPQQSKEDADYVQSVAINAVEQLLVNPKLLAAQDLSSMVDQHNTKWAIETISNARELIRNNISERTTDSLYASVVGQLDSLSEYLTKYKFGYYSMVWVKASEKPKESGEYVCRFGTDKYIIKFDGKRWGTSNPDFVWLDENNTEPLYTLEELNKEKEKSYKNGWNDRSEATLY